MEKYFKKIRKYLNRPSEKEASLINRGCQELKQMAEKTSTKYNNDEREQQQKRDGICPVCKESKIVNKIARVEGSGYVSGSFYLGSGSVYGRSSTDTNEVNHCNSCGNQWKKYSRHFKGTDTFIADWLDDLNTVSEGKYSYGDRTVELLKDIPAESIWREGLRVKDKCMYSTRENLTLSFLRTKFKTVYE